MKVSIDRPAGSTHPDFGWKYPINYGFVVGTKAPDGEPIDAYVLGVTEPLTQFSGRVVAIVHRLDDYDDKLVVSNQERMPDEREIRDATRFQERFFESEIILAPRVVH